MFAFICTNFHEHIHQTQGYIIFSGTCPANLHRILKCVLITKERTPIATKTSLTIRRIRMGKSYNNVRLITNKWSKLVTCEHKKLEVFTPHRTVRITFDHSDGKQQTITGNHMTHHTTRTIFQARYTDDEEPVHIENRQYEEQEF